MTLAYKGHEALLVVRVILVRKVLLGNLAISAVPVQEVGFDSLFSFRNAFEILFCF